MFVVFYCFSYRIIYLQVGDIISVIDMPPPSESVWWKGKLTILSSPRQFRDRTQSDVEDTASPSGAVVNLNTTSPPTNFQAHFEVNKVTIDYSGIKLQLIITQ